MWEFKGAYAVGVLEVNCTVTSHWNQPRLLDNFKFSNFPQLVCSFPLCWEWHKKYSGPWSILWKAKTCYKYTISLYQIKGLEDSGLLGYLKKRVMCYFFTWIENKEREMELKEFTKKSCTDQIRKMYLQMKMLMLLVGLVTMTATLFRN